MAVSYTHLQAAQAVALRVAAFQEDLHLFGCNVFVVHDLSLIHICCVQFSELFSSLQNYQTRGGKHFNLWIKMPLLRP